MAISFVHRSFASGELSPSLAGRADLSKYQSGLRTCRNFAVARWGGVFNRAGFEFMGEVRYSSKATRLLRFRFNSSQTYGMEFGDQYIRFLRDGAQVTEATKTITNITQASPPTVTSAAHGYSNGDDIYVTGIVGMVELNNRNFRVAGVTPGTYEITDYAGTNIDTSLFTAYQSGGTSARVYTIASPYLEADLFDLKITQSGDVVTIAHDSYATRELSRTAHTSWTLAAVSFTPSITGPTNVLFTKPGAGATVFRYQVTAIKTETLEESLPGAGVAKVITAITTANPANVTSAAHGFITGDEVSIAAVLGMTQINGATAIIIRIDANNFTLTGVDSTAYTAYTSAGTATRTGIISAAPTDAAPMVISWTAVSGATQYVVYKELNGVYGYIGIAGSTTFNDTNITADVTDTPPEDRGLFDATDDYPSVPGYFQQRLILANSNNEPERLDASQTGNFHNYARGTPLQDDDAFNFVCSGREVNEVRAVLDLGKLLIFTSGGVHVALGNADGAVTMEAINLRQHLYVGCSDIPPIPTGSSALFVQDGGQVVNDLNYDFSTDAYKGNEVSIYSAHLFEGKSIIEWAYAETPHSIVWSVRDDGKLLGLTYLRAHEVVGWHRHDTTNGYFESVTSMPEGTEYATYCIIQRTIDGRDVRYIERMHSRVVADIRADAFFVDSGLTYDGRHTGSITMTLTGTSYAFDEDMTLTASSSYFTPAKMDNGIELVLYEDDGVTVSARLMCSIEQYVSGTVVIVHADRNVPAAFQAVAVADWGEAVDELRGLNHLEGETIAILGDGNELAQQVVTDGMVTLDNVYVVIHAGLPIQADIETLAIENLQGETLLDKRKLINKATMLVQDSRGMQAGPDEDNLTEWDQREVTDQFDPIQPFSGQVEIELNSTWENNGRVFVRQDSPLPLTILSIVPSGRTGG